MQEEEEESAKKERRQVGCNMEMKEENRAKIGKLTGIVGMTTNLGLAITKILIGQMASSMSILADGLNNLSDVGSSVVTFIGFKMAEKPADREHPYGHARAEYLASLIVSVMILLIGGELLKTSFFKIIQPEITRFSSVSMGILLGSIIVKFWLMKFNIKMGKKINSKTLIATAEDSRNDILATGVVLVAGMVEYFLKLQIDGIAGVVLSCFILYSGISLAKDTVSPILGEGGSSTLRKEIIDYILDHENVLGCHDLMIHDYGPYKRYASIHLEMDYTMDVMEGHEIIDKIEKEVKQKFDLELLIHHDPVITDDLEVVEMKDLIETLLSVRDRRIHLHDFRMIKKERKKEITFDMVLPPELYKEAEKIKKSLDEALNRIGKGKCSTEITFDIEIDD